MTCPKGIGCGGIRCINCLKDVNPYDTVILYSERPDAFRVIYSKVVKTRCSG